MIVARTRVCLLVVFGLYEFRIIVSFEISDIWMVVARFRVCLLGVFGLY